MWRRSIGDASRRLHAQYEGVFAGADIGVGYPMISMRDIEAGRHTLTRDDFGQDRGSPIVAA